MDDLCHALRLAVNYDSVSRPFISVRVLFVSDQSKTLLMQNDKLEI